MSGYAYPFENPSEMFLGNKRAGIRVHCRLTVQFSHLNENCHGTCWNLGSHGMYIAFDGLIGLGETVDVSFFINEEYPTLVEATGRVVWGNIGPGRNNDELPEGFGVMFIDIAPDAASAIDRFIAQK